MHSFYTYFHTRNDTGAVFYVGKGKGRRAYDRGRNPYWNNIVAKHGYTVHFAMMNLSEADAFEHEKLLIKCFKDLNTPLCNMSDGGEGQTGFKFTEDQRSNFKCLMTPERIDKIVKANTGLIRSEDHRKAISDANRSKNMLPSTKKLISEAMKALRKSEKEAGYKRPITQYMCSECLIVLNPGPLGRHQKKHGHTGKTKVAYREEPLRRAPDREKVNPYAA